MLGLVDMTSITTIWGHSSAGRAPTWHATYNSQKPLIVVYIWVCIGNIKTSGAELGAITIRQL